MKNQASNIALNAARRHYTISACQTIAPKSTFLSIQRRNLPLTTNLRSGFSSSSVTSDPAEIYTSPLRDYFTEMKSGKTALGTDHTKLKPLADERANIPRLECGIPEHLLRFSTTCYGRLSLTPYTMPNEYKVTMKVSMRHIPLETDLEREIFLKIVDNRFLPERNELRLSANQFASRIENKRHLCSMLDRIVNGAKTLAKDTQGQSESQLDSWDTCMLTLVRNKFFAYTKIFSISDVFLIRYT